MFVPKMRNMFNYSEQFFPIKASFSQSILTKIVIFIFFAKHIDGMVNLQTPKRQKFEGLLKLFKSTNILK